MLYNIKYALHISEVIKLILLSNIEYELVRLFSEIMYKFYSSLM